MSDRGERAADRVGGAKGYLKARPRSRRRSAARRDPWVSRSGPSRTRGLGSKRTENLCKPDWTSNCRAVAQLLSSATATVPQAGRALFCRRYMSQKAETPRQVARHGLTWICRSLAPQTPTPLPLCPARFIPALAGNATWPLWICGAYSVHPRAGGERVVVRGQWLELDGSSPRWRGTPAIAL